MMCGVLVTDLAPAVQARSTIGKGIGANEGVHRAIVVGAAEGEGRPGTTGALDPRAAVAV